MLTYFFLYICVNFIAKIGVLKLTIILADKTSGVMPSDNAWISQQVFPMNENNSMLSAMSSVCFDFNVLIACGINVMLQKNEAIYPIKIMLSIYVVNP